MPHPVPLTTDFCTLVEYFLSLRCFIPGARGDIKFFFTEYSCKFVIDARDRHDYLLAPA